MKRVIFSFLFSLTVFISFSQNGSLITGKVTDIEGNSLSGASVTIVETGGGALTSEDGSFDLRDLPDGSYTVKFSFIGYEPETVKVKLQTRALVNVTLKEASYITGEVLVSATRAGEYTPLAYSTISNEILRKSNVSADMPYLLSLSPSVVETSESGNGIGYTGLRIRGTDANRINVTIDGIPLNDPESHTVFWVDLPDLASSVDNIQIQRGVGTSSNGAGAFGATVSIQTLNPETEPSATISSSYGSFNTLRNMVSASTGLINDRFALQMRYSDLKSDGYVDRTWADHRSTFISGLYRTEKSMLKANIILGEEHTGLGWWGVPLDSLKTNRTYNPAGEYTDTGNHLRYYDNESDNYNQNHFQLIFSRKAGNNFSMNAALHYTRGIGYYEEYREDQDFAEYKLTPFPIGNETIEATDMIRRKWLDNHFAGMVYSVSYRRNRIEMTTGGGLNTYLGDHYGTVVWMRNAGNTEKDYSWYFNNSVKSEFNIYGKMNYQISDFTRLFGDLQYRYIYYQMDGEDDDLKNLSQRHRFGFFNPKAGLFHQINDNQDTWLSFAVANREPTRNDFKEASGDPDVTPEPETLFDIESGYRIRSGNSTFSVNLYGMFYNDQLVPTGELSDVGYPVMTNVKSSYRIGTELSAAVRLSDYFIWNTNLTLSRNKIRNFIEYYTDYNTSDWSSRYLGKELGLVDIAYSPSQVFTSDFSYGKGMFMIHLVTKFVGKQYFDNTMNEQRSIDPYIVNNLRFDLSPAIRGTKSVNIQLFVNNFLNHVYENNAYGGNWYEDGNEKTWAYYFPQAGINYMLKAAISF